MAASDASVRSAAELLAGARRVVVFSGAGVSAESGIDTFRDAGGLWERYPPDEFATAVGLVRQLVEHPERVARFLHDLLAPVARARPNPGHLALDALEQRLRALGGRLVVVTQNVDRLHQEAGSSEVLEVHGSLFEIVDDSGAHQHTLTRAELARVVDGLARAERGLFRRTRMARALSPLLGLPHPRRPLVLAHRPSVVLFGEALPERAWSEAKAQASRADVLIAVGTSGTVYPAAELPELAAAAGARVIGVGPEVGDADVWLNGAAGDVLRRLVERATALA